MTDLPAPADWLPLGDEPSDGAAAPPDGLRAGDWLPDGLPAGQPDMDAAAEAAPPPAPLSRPPEPLPPEPLVDDLPEAAPDEDQAVDESYRALQQSVHRLRSQLDHETTEQRGTIVELEERLAQFERDLRSAPPRPRPATRIATALRIALFLALFVVVASAPLFATRRSSCVTHRRFVTHWSVVAPFSTAHPAPGCRAESGGTVLLKSLGFE